MSLRAAGYEGSRAERCKLDRDPVIDTGDELPPRSVAVEVDATALQVHGAQVARRGPRNLDLPTFRGGDAKQPPSHVPIPAIQERSLS